MVADGPALLESWCFLLAKSTFTVTQVNLNLSAALVPGTIWSKYLFSICTKDGYIVAGFVTPHLCAKKSHDNPTVSLGTQAAPSGLTFFLVRFLDVRQSDITLPIWLREIRPCFPALVKIAAAAALALSRP